MVFFPVPPKDAAGIEPVEPRTGEPQQFNVRCGLFGAAIGACGSAVMAIALPVGFWVSGWDYPGVRRDDLEFAIRDQPELLAVPVLACAVFGACAGWATYAPPRLHRFAWSLVWVFLMSVFLWLLVAGLGLAPIWYKGIDAWAYYPRLALFTVTPPVLAATVLTALRVRGARSGQA